MSNWENIIKEVCKSLKLTQKELSNMLDISYPTILRWSWDNDKIPKMSLLTLKLILENIELKEKLDSIKKAQTTLQEINQY